jgi:hypothetical protein
MSLAKPTVDNPPRQRVRITGPLLTFALVAAGLLTSCASHEACGESSAEAHAPIPPEALQSLYSLGAGQVPPYRQDAARFDHLWDYFKDANRELMSHLDRLKQLYRTGQNHAGATYIAGPSGVGKSYVIRQLDLPEQATTGPIKLATLFLETVPDLATLDGERIFNRLPGAASVSLEDLLPSQDAAQRAFILIDDLDEIHRESALQLLRSVEAAVRARTGGFLHVVVFGRPESFWPWLSHPERHPPAQVSPRPFLLQGPDFQTTGDVVFRCHDYYQWKYQQNAPPAVTNDLLAQLQRFGFLRPCFRPLATGNFVLDGVIAVHQNAVSAPPTERQLRRQLFRLLLERNRESHGRPDADDDTYCRLLETAAAFPLLHHRTIDDHGFFDVRAADTLSFVDDQGQARSVGLRNLLDRSGLILLDPDQSDKTAYRFEPLWLHATLVEAWQRRMSGG